MSSGETISIQAPIKISYKGNTYCANFNNEEGEYCLDESGKAIQTLFDNNPNVAILINSENDYELFDTYEELEQHLKMTTTPANTKAAIEFRSKVNVHLCKDPNLKKDQTFSFMNSGSRAIADLSSVGLYEEISSLKLDGEYANVLYRPRGFITLWDKKNYQGYSLTVRIPTDKGKIETSLNDLRTVGKTLPPLQPQYWDDEARSAKFGYQ